MQKGAFAAAACSAILLLTLVAQAQIETTPIPLPPKPNFSPMQFYVGTWNCVSTNTRRPNSFTDTVTYQMDSSGYWMNAKDVFHATSWAPQPSVTITKTTYDPSTSRWVSISTDDQGGYDMSTSSGWKGNTIVWHDQAYPKTNNVSSNGDTTVTKVSSSKTTAAGTFTEPSGRVIKAKTTCTKTS